MSTEQYWSDTGFGAGSWALVGYPTAPELKASLILHSAQSVSQTQVAPTVAPIRAVAVFAGAR